MIIVALVAFLALVSECTLIPRVLRTKPSIRLISRAYSSTNGGPLGMIKFLSPVRPVLTPCHDCTRCSSQEACMDTAAIINYFVDNVAEAIYNHVRDRPDDASKPLHEIFRDSSTRKISNPEESNLKSNEGSPIDEVHVTVKSKRPEDLLLPVAPSVSISDANEELAGEELGMTGPDLIDTSEDPVQFIEDCRMYMVYAPESAENDAFLESIKDELLSVGYLKTPKSKQISSLDGDHIFFMSDALCNTIAAVKRPCLEKDGRSWSYCVLVRKTQH